MNKKPDLKMTNTVSQPKSVEGYIQLLSTPTIFEMDLVGKNLQMNGIDVVLFYPDVIDHPDEISALLVKSDQKEKALSILASLDLTDFVTYYG